MEAAGHYAAGMTSTPSDPDASFGEAENETFDIHMTVLATWLVHTVGSAFLWAAVLPLLLGVAGAISNAAVLFVAAAVSGPFVFAWRLINARAPMPFDVESN